MYKDKPLGEFLNELSAKCPTPGGGSAAALSAAIGAALMAMVANYTAGNEKYKDCDKRVAAILPRVEKYRDELLRLMDADAKAYARLADCLKQQADKSGCAERFYKDAVTPPFEMCRIASEALGLCKELAVCGNKNLITDTAVAAILLDGAFHSARFNVYINLKYVKDTDFIAKVHGVLNPLEESMPLLKEEILELCEDAIS